MSPPARARREVRAIGPSPFFLSVPSRLVPNLFFSALVEKNEGLAKELEEERGRLSQETEEHGRLLVAVDILREYLEVPEPASSAELVQGVEDMPRRVHALGVASLRYGARQTLAIARAHYENINLDALSLGFPADYTDEELDGFEEVAAPFAAALAEGMKGDDEFPCKPLKP